MRQNVLKVAQGSPGYAPGAYAAVLLEDAQRLLDSALSDDAVTALWRTATGRRHATDDFDADGRFWLAELARLCREYLANVDPLYTALVSPARTPLWPGRFCGRSATSPRH
ncbi:hypothetical protein ACLMNJ_32805 [Streptomyces seoulensis]